MSNLWFNIRFGVRHLQVGPERPYVRLAYNEWLAKNRPKKWFAVYCWFGTHYN